MISVQNRLPEPGKENRVSITPDNGSAVEGVLAYADDATQEGTFWNRKTAQLLQGDIRTYPVREGQSISAGDVVNVGGSPETVYKDVVAQDNVENVINSSAVTATDTCYLNEQYSITVLATSSNVVAYLIDNATGKSVSNATVYSSSGVTSVSVARLDGSYFVVSYNRNQPYLRMGKVTGQSISFTSEVGPWAGRSAISVVRSLSKNYFFFAANDNDLNCLYVRVGTNANGVVGSVSATQLYDVIPNYISACKLPDDSNGNKRVCICFSDTGDGNKGKAVIATIDSSNAVTFGDVVTFDENNSSYIDCCVSNGFIVVAYQQILSGNNAAIKVLSDPALEIQNSALLYDSSTGANYISILPTKNGIAYMQGSIVNGTPQSRIVTIPVLEIGDNYGFNNAPSNYLSSTLISENKILLAYADVNNSNYGTTTILEVNGNQIVGSFLDNSSDAIALADGTGGQEIPVGFGGYCECPGVTEGQTIDSSGVSAVAVQDGWLLIKDAWSKDYVTGEYSGTDQGYWSIDVGFKPSVLLIQEVGFYASGGYSTCQYIAFIKGCPYGGVFNGTNTTLNVTFTNTGLSFNGYIFNKSDCTYYYVAWR